MDEQQIQYAPGAEAVQNFVASTINNYVSSIQEHTMTPAEELMAARDVISDPKNWIKRALAVDHYGFGTKLQSAVKFCANGAMCKAHCNGAAQSALNRTAREMGYDSVPDLNDKTDHNTVMEMFDRAIRLAKESE